MGEVLPNKRGQKARECIACMTKMDKKAFKDADVREKIKRWRQFSSLRELYTDRDLFREFESILSTLVVRSKVIEKGNIAHEARPSSWQY